MGNLKKTLDSGAELEITMASFSEGHHLLQVVMREVEVTKLSLGISKDSKVKSLADLELNDEVINTIKNIVSSLIASEAVTQALKPCMSRATYNNVRVTNDLFEDENIRKDYLVVAKEVLFYNLLPFFGNLASLLKGVLEKNASTQKQG